MPEVNLASFNKLLKNYNKFERKYNELDDKLNNWDTEEDIVIYEGVITDMRDIIDELKEINSQLKGMLYFVKIGMPEKKERYESMLNHLNYALPRRIREHNDRVEELNMDSKNNDYYDNWRV